MTTGLENLEVYKMAETLELKVFHLTKSFPPEEKYRSVDQLKRSSSSVSNNIAESYYKRSVKNKIRILQDIVKSEAEETRRNLNVCLKKGFHDDEDVLKEYTEFMKALSGYIRFLNQKLITNN